MNQVIGVESLTAQFLQHAQNQTLASGNIAGQPNDIRVAHIYTASMAVH
jgi:hypothetical protein